MTGHELRHRRQKMSVSQAELADACGRMTQQEISRQEERGDKPLSRGMEARLEIGFRRLEKMVASGQMAARRKEDDRDH
jgi:transcriptional regulator with XRE-family HTH domain